MDASSLHMGDRLGLQPPATESDILRVVEGRLAPSIITRLLSVGLERAETA